MAKFSVEYKHEKTYSEKVEIEISLNQRPDKDDYQSILDSIETLNKIAHKYIKLDEVKKDEKTTSK